METERILKNISETLLQHGDTIANPGLIYGKMGHAVFFFHYAQYSNNNLFNDYALNVIKAIRTEINKDNARDYDSGLAGIGVGIEYLSQNGFLKINTDFVLKNFDLFIRREIMYGQDLNFSFGNGLCGLGQYLLFRLNCQTVKTDEYCSLFNQESMLHLVNVLENSEYPSSNELPDVLFLLCRLYSLHICNPKIDRYMNKLLTNFSDDDVYNESFSVWALTFLRMASAGYKTEDSARNAIDRVLQVMESDDSYSENKTSKNINRLLWLLKCKRIIIQTGVSIDSLDRLDALIVKTLRQTDDLLSLEDGRFSLTDNVYAGLAIMTIGKQCNDGWLELLG